MPQWSIVQVRSTLTAQKTKRVRKYMRGERGVRLYAVFSVFERNPGLFSPSCENTAIIPGSKSIRVLRVLGPLPSELDCGEKETRLQEVCFGLQHCELLN